MLTIKECKKILEKDGLVYTDDQLELAIEILSKIAEIEIQQILKID